MYLGGPRLIYTGCRSGLVRRFYVTEGNVTVRPHVTGSRMFTRQRSLGYSANSKLALSDRALNCIFVVIY